MSSRADKPEKSTAASDAAKRRRNPDSDSSSNLSRIEGLFADGIEQPGGIEGPPSADTLPTEDLPLIEPPLPAELPSTELPSTELPLAEEPPPLTIEQSPAGPTSDQELPAVSTTVSPSPFVPSTIAVPSPGAFDQKAPQQPDRPVPRSLLTGGESTAVGSSEMIWQSLQQEHPISSMELIDGQTPVSVLTFSRPFSSSGAVDISQVGIDKNAEENPAVYSEALLVQLIEQENLNRIWSDDEILLVEQVADQLSLALQNANLFQQSRSRAEQLAILNEMSRKLSEQLDVEQVCHTVYRYTATLIDATVFYIALNIKETRQVEFPLRVDNGQITPPYRREYLNGLTEYIFEHGQPLLIPDNLADFVTRNLGINLVGPMAQSWLGVPMIYGDEVTGAISLQSYTQTNLYTPEHRDLLTAIANQAAVAIQNARLYTQEQRRRQIADTLSDIARAVSTGLNVSEISNQVLEQLNKLIPYRSAFLQLIDPSGARQTIARQGATDQDTQAAAAVFDRPVKDDPLIRQIVETRQPLLLADTQADSRWEMVPETASIRSWMAAPLLAAAEVGERTASGERSASGGGTTVIGLVIIDHEQPDTYDAASVELLTTVCAQVAVGIQNARLFQQTRSAFAALEVSERYQKAVALATSVLTERGIAALSDVLTALGEAAQTGRAYYFETQVDQRGPYWRVIAEWHSPEIPPQINNPALRRLSLRFIGPWVEELRASGKIAAPVSELSPEIQEFFRPLGTQSVLQFAVPGRHEMPGCIAFEQLDYPRRWHDDEIAALQTAAASLANTIAREDLFTQVQINLAETEALYQASARLNSAGSFDDILTVLRQHTILGHMNASNVTIHLFDRAWTLTTKPDWLIPIASWSARPGTSAIAGRSVSIFAADSGRLEKSQAASEAALSPSLTVSAAPAELLPAGETKAAIDRSPSSAPEAPSSVDQALARTPFSEWSSHEKLMHPDRPSAISDILTDPRIDEAGRKLFSEQMGGKSLLVALLNVAGQWMGHIIAIYRQTTGFPENELRRLMSLAGQAGVAVQNQHLLEEASHRARQLQTAAEIARDTSGTLSLETLLNRVVNLLRERFNYYHVSVFLVEDSDSQSSSLTTGPLLPKTAAQRIAAVYEATGEAGEELKRRQHSLVVGSRSVIGQVTVLGQSVVLNDLGEEAARAIHRPNPLLPLTRAELGMPLKSGERVIGALDVQATQPNAFPPEDVAVLQILADQIAVAVENARSYALAQQAAEELREADRLKSQFLANMSHELRTPLNSIIGFSRVILKGIDGPINELQTQDLSAIYNSGQHLLGLINDVLDVSKIEAGKMELAFEENVVLADIIRGVMSTTVGLVKDKPVELHQEVDPDLPLLRIDSMKIRQVLINFLSNAAKFTEKGSITVQAKKQLSESGLSEVIVKVIDTGPGIALEDQAKLFQPFSQVDGSLTRKVGGSGLGLSICRHLIDMHGGRVGVESEEGKGSAFYFTLPLAAPSTPDEDVQDTSDISADASGQTADSAAPDALSAEQQPDVEALQTGSTSPVAEVTQVITEQPLAKDDSSITELPEAELSPEVVPSSEASQLPEADLSLEAVQTPEKVPSSETGIAPGVSQLPEAALSPEEGISPEAALLPETVLSPEAVLLPTAVPPESETTQPESLQEEEITAAPVAEEEIALGGLILAVDKDPKVIDVYKRWLAGHNVTVIALTELQQVATVSRGLQPAAITLDIAMQASGPTPTTIVDGWSVLQELKSEPSTRDIPVVICSLLAEQEKAMSMGAAAYLLKPILEGDLLQALKIAQKQRAEIDQQKTTSQRR